MAIPQEKISIAKMTLVELQDLLHRQEKIVANKNFVKRLPDKGAKILAFIERIKTTIETQSHLDETTQLFEKMALKADTARSRPGDREQELLGAIVNPALQEKTVIDERIEESEMKTDIYLTETYVRVIKNPHKETNDKERFRPNRGKTKPSSKDNESGDTPMNGAMDGGNAQRDVHRPNSKLKHRYDDSLEECMSRGEGKHEATKLIPIDESVRLLQIQKHKQEQHQTQQAMERLAQRLNVKTAPFDPEGSRKMAYRDQPGINSDEEVDSDDEGEVTDYPDQPTSTRTPANLTAPRRLHSPTRTQPAAD